MRQPVDFFEHDTCLAAVFLSTSSVMERLNSGFCRSWSSCPEALPKRSSFDYHCKLHEKYTNKDDTNGLNVPRIARRDHGN